MKLADEQRLHALMKRREAGESLSPALEAEYWHLSDLWWESNGIHHGGQVLADFMPRDDLGVTP